MLHFNNDQQPHILFRYPGEQDWMVRKGKTPVSRAQDEQRDLCLKLSRLRKISLNAEEIRADENTIRKMQHGSSDGNRTAGC